MTSRSLAGLCLLLSGCGSSLEDQEALWRARGPSGYQYTYSSGGAALHVQLRVTVQSRVVTRTIVLAPPDLPGPLLGFTVEQLFEDIRKRLYAASCKVTARYDEALGYPLSVYSDCGQEGDSWNVTDLSAS
jgi:hypothetical protein